MLTIKITLETLKLIEEKYKDYIVETLTNTSHFGSNNEYVILI